MSAHGYGAYTRGCRCEVCRAAKADYMRGARRRGRVRAQRLTVSSNGKSPNGYTAFAAGATRALVPNVKHGRHAYEVHGCRCRDCTRAHTVSDRSRYPLAPIVRPATAPTPVAGRDTSPS